MIKFHVPLDHLHYAKFNPFIPNAPFLNPLKTLCFQGVEKGYIGNEWVKSNPWSGSRIMRVCHFQATNGQLALIFFFFSFSETH